MNKKTGNGRAVGKKSVLAGVRDFLPPDALDIGKAIDQIEANWSKVKSRSMQNWRLEYIPLKADSDYKERDWRVSEVLMERTICDQCREKQYLIWNQIPVASGLLPLPSEKKGDGKRRVASEGKRAIDLVYQPDGSQDVYEFLELKIRRKGGAADTLLHATLELLEYGLLYLFSRKNKETLQYEDEGDGRYVVLKALEIRLRVLADADYYEGNDNSEVPVEAINRALAAHIDHNRTSYGSLKMDIGFQVLGKADTPSEGFIGKEEWLPGQTGK